MLIDGNTFNYGYIGSRATGNEAGRLPGRGSRLAGPDARRHQEGLPLDHTVLACALPDAALQPGRHAQCREESRPGTEAQPLSAYLSQSAPIARSGDQLPQDQQGTSSRRTSSSTSTSRSSSPPPGPEEQAIRAKLARIGIGPGKTFDFKDLSLEHKAEIGLGMKEGEKKVEEKVAKSARTSTAGGSARHLATGRSSMATGCSAPPPPRLGIYGNDAVEAMYPMIRNDATGQPLDGSQHTYTLTFPAGQLPPVNAFWSVTMYDGKTQLLIKNPIDRYLINSPMLPQMKANADGSLTILHSEGLAGCGQGVQLAAGPGRADLPRHASVLAQDRAPVDSASR